jgi:hypothetical protein
MLLDFGTREALAARAAGVDPTLWQRDQKKLARIESAQSVEELLERVTSATGLGEQAWLKRLRTSGPGAAPVIAEWFKSLRLASLHKDRTLIEEKCIEALRWYGEAGIAPILEVWDTLSDYGRSLAAAVLGLLEARQATDRIWSLYQKVKDNRRENLLAGALWSLIDLQDERAADALWEQLTQGRRFYELFGFLSRAGDRRAIIPLLQLATGADQTTKAEAMWAVTGIAHRIGRMAFLEELDQASTPGDEVGPTREAIVDRVFSFPAAAVQEYFEPFYQRKGIDLSSVRMPRETPQMKQPRSLLRGIWWHHQSDS